MKANFNRIQFYIVGSFHWTNILDEEEEDPYIRALDEHNRRKPKEENIGAVHLNRNNRNITKDFC